MKKDKRQINKIWQATNPLGEVYEYAKIGSGKNSYIKTLRYIGKLEEIEWKPQLKEK